MQSIDSSPVSYNKSVVFVSGNEADFNRSKRLYAFFKSRKRLYYVFLFCMTLCVLISFCVFDQLNTANEKQQILDIFKSIPLFNEALSFRLIFDFLLKFMIISFFVFLSGLTILSPVFSFMFNIYFYLNAGYMISIALFAYKMNTVGLFSLALIILAVAAKSLVLTLFSTEAFKYSFVARCGIEQIFKKENFIPYLFVFIFYVLSVFAITTTLKFLL